MVGRIKALRVAEGNSANPNFDVKYHPSWQNKVLKYLDCCRGAFSAIQGVPWRAILKAPRRGTDMIMAHYNSQWLEWLQPPKLLTAALSWCAISGNLVKPTGNSALPLMTLTCLVVSKGNLHYPRFLTGLIGVRGGVGGGGAVLPVIYAWWAATWSHQLIS